MNLIDLPNQTKLTELSERQCLVIPNVLQSHKNIVIMTTVEMMSNNGNPDHGIFFIICAHLGLVDFYLCIEKSSNSDVFSVWPTVML